MMRFNFLNDAPPEFVERARNIRIAAELRTPLSALLTAVLVVLTWWGLENYWLSSAQREEALAEVRLTESQADLAATKLVRTNVDDMLALDRRLRDIRLSGSILASRLSDIGNHVPEHAWLTSISNLPDGLEIAGKADGLAALSQTVTDLMSSKTAASPTLVRAAKDDRGKNLIAFTVQVEKKNDASR